MYNNYLTFAKVLKNIYNIVFQHTWKLYHLVGALKNVDYTKRENNIVSFTVDLFPFLSGSTYYWA